MHAAANGHASANGELIVAHTSDLHLGGRWHKGGEFDSLRAVLDAAGETRAQVLILAGDVFDSHRAAADIVEGAVEMMAAAACEIVILPGNHDPATPDAVYRRESIAEIPNVHVLGITTGGSVQFGELGLEITGSPHVAYADFTPLASISERTMRWNIVVAHGHWVTSEQDAHRGWLIHDHEIAASGADYVALGHWDLPQPVGDGTVPAYYSGSPELARTVNIVTFVAGSAPDVRRHPLHIGS
jgi:DNA repair exonuclease SbcCD nuclease subunit